MFERISPGATVADGVAERGRDEAAARELLVLGARPGEERVDERTHRLVAPHLSLRGREIAELAVGGEDRVDAPHAVEAERMPTDRGLPVFPPDMREAPDLDGRRPAFAGLLLGSLRRNALEEGVVDDVGVGLHVADERAPVRQLVELLGREKYDGRLAVLGEDDGLPARANAGDDLCARALELTERHRVGRVELPYAVAHR
jgi:hypothetical protein